MNSGGGVMWLLLGAVAGFVFGQATKACPKAAAAPVKASTGWLDVLNTVIKGGVDVYDNWGGSDTKSSSAGWGP
jgi:hypothetical protein